MEQPTVEKGRKTRTKHTRERSMATWRLHRRPTPLRCPDAGMNFLPEVEQLFSDRRAQEYPRAFQVQVPLQNSPIRAKWRLSKRRCICLEIMAPFASHFGDDKSTTVNSTESTTIEPKHSAVLLLASVNLSLVAADESTSPGLFHR
jgi:hypothetical protein